MSEMRTKMLQDLQLRNYAKASQRLYINNVAHFAKHFGKSPDKLGPKEIREFQLHLLARKVSWSNFNGHVATLRFFYKITLKRQWMVERIPFGKKEKRLPVVLTTEEVSRLVDKSTEPFRTLFITIYATGMRLNEACTLKVADIDSQGGTILISQGKGNKDRNIPLDAKLLRILRQHWCKYRNLVWLFPSPRSKKPFHPTTVQKAFKKARTRANIRKVVTPKTLRHCFATHLLEAGTDIRVIQRLLGHAYIHTTLIYTHVTTKALNLAVSPISNLENIP